MELKELIAKLGIESTADNEKVLTEFAKSQTVGIEKSMQERINALTKEKHELKGQISDLTAKSELASSEVTKLTETVKELESAKTELQTFREQQATKKREGMKAVMDSINSIKDTDKRFENVAKVKAKMVIKEKLEEYTEAEIEKNLDVWNMATELGAIDKITGSETPAVPPSSNPASGNKTYFETLLEKQQKS